MESPIYHLTGVVKEKTEHSGDFIGPLDLILYLLSKNKMEIQDIQISLILEQYLDWMNRRKQLDLEVTSEFVAMAAHLVYIKTRMLLSVNEEEAVSELEQLISSLEEHKRHESYERIKTLLPELERRYRIGRNCISRLPEPLPSDKAYRYAHRKEDLTRAMSAILARNGDKLPPPAAVFEGIVGREPYPVNDKAAELLRHLEKIGTTRFQNLFQGSSSRSEIVATFVAVLELCKANRIRLTDGGDVIFNREKTGQPVFSTDVY